jgi:ribonuclease HII
MTKRTKPHFDFEERARQQGFSRICGVDEVGRGPLAGPVVAACVILDRDNIPPGLNDSKQLSEIKRQQLFAELLQTAHIGIASVQASLIDAVNIRQAGLLAMRQAVLSMPVKPDYCLIDGRDIPDLSPLPSQAIIQGDAQSLSIAAASIVAKVIRDAMMAHASYYYPAFGFERHKGYGTAAHRQVLAGYGPCPLHRQSFKSKKI